MQDHEPQTPATKRRAAATKKKTRKRKRGKAQRHAKQRRALSQVGGATRGEGDPRIAALLARAATPTAGGDGRHLTHGFHAWPARMHPHTAATLIGAIETAGVIFDPFMGGGTTMLEARLAGRAGHGADVNPVAKEVAWARTRSWDGAKTRELVRAGGVAVERARKMRLGRRKVPREFFIAEGQWYDPPALLEVWCLARTIESATTDRTLTRMLRACLSSLLVKASRQVSDSITSLDRDHSWVPAGRVESWFSARVEEHARQLDALREALGRDDHEPVLLLRDAREPVSIDARVAAIVTSPPYPATYDYVAQHRRRYAALGLDPSLAERAEIGSRSDAIERGWEAARETFERDLTRVMTAWIPLLADDAPAYLVVGDGQRRGGVIRTLPLVERAAKTAGLRVLASVSQRRTPRGHVRGPRGAAKEEHIVALGVSR